MSLPLRSLSFPPADLGEVLARAHWPGDPAPVLRALVQAGCDRLRPAALTICVKDEKTCRREQQRDHVSSCRDSITADVGSTQDQERRKRGADFTFRQPEDK